MVQASAAPAGSPARFMQINATMLPKAKFEPTLRSMPPPTMTTISPSTTQPNSPSWRPLTTRLPGEKKSGIRVPNSVSTITRKAKGVALSTQPLERISPTTWSGNKR